MFQRTRTGASVGHLWGGLSAIPSLGNVAGAEHSSMSGIGEVGGSLQNLVWSLLF